MIKNKAKHALKALVTLLIPSRRRLGRIQSITSDLSAGTLAIDVGASYFPHVRWGPLRQSQSNIWIAVDPNAHNLRYLNNWKQYYKSQLIAVPTGLAKVDGSHSLYVTNVDSGSSLLEPIVSEDWRPRVDESYFFPTKLLEITCFSLTTLLQTYCADFQSAPVWIKLDTQGTELSILEGLLDSYYQNRVVFDPLNLSCYPLAIAKFKFNKIVFCKRFDGDPSVF